MKSYHFEKLMFVWAIPFLVGVVILLLVNFSGAELVGLVVGNVVGAIFCSIAVVGFVDYVRWMVSEWEGVLYYDENYMIRTRGLDSFQIRHVRGWARGWLARPIGPLSMVQKYLMAGGYRWKKLPEFIYVTIMPLEDVEVNVGMGIVRRAHGFFYSNHIDMAYFHDWERMKDLAIHEFGHAILHANGYGMDEEEHHRIMNEIGIL